MERPRTEAFISSRDLAGRCPRWTAENKLASFNGLGKQAMMPGDDRNRHQQTSRRPHPSAWADLLSK